MKKVIFYLTTCFLASISFGQEFEIALENHFKLSFCNCVQNNKTNILDEDEVENCLKAEILKSKNLYSKYMDFDPNNDDKKNDDVRKKIFNDNIEEIINTCDIFYTKLDESLDNILNLYKEEFEIFDIKTVNNLIKENPENADLYGVRALIHWKDKNYKEASKDFYNGYYLDSSNTNFLMFIAITKAKANEFVEAIDIFQKLINDFGEDDLLPLLYLTKRKLKESTQN